MSEAADAAEGIIPNALLHEGGHATLLRVFVGDIKRMNEVGYELELRVPGPQLPETC